MIHRLMKSTIKPQHEKVRSRSKSPAHKFQYKLPQSFFEAVDEARVEAGYDILPRFHHLSVSKSPSLSSHRSSKNHRHHQTEHKHSHSSSMSDTDDASRKKIRLRRKTRKHSHHHRHHHKDKSRGSSPKITISDAPKILLNLAKNVSIQSIDK